MKPKRLLYGLAALLSVIGMARSAGAQAAAVGSADTLLAAMSDPGACCEEVPLGDAAADAVCLYAGADVALIPGGCFRANLQGGEFTRDDVAAIFPEEDTLGVAEMTASQLCQALEQSVSTFTLGEDERVDYARSAYDGFLQVSGVTFRFDVSAPVGERVTEAVLDDGTALHREDDETVLTVVSTTQLLDGGYDYSARAYSPLDLSLPDVFIWYVGQIGGAISVPLSGRVTMIGSSDSSFLGDMAPSALIFLVCIFLIYAVYRLTLGRSPAWKALQDRVKPETEEEKNSALNKLLK